MTIGVAAAARGFSWSVCVVFNCTTFYSSSTQLSVACPGLGGSPCKEGTTTRRTCRGKGRRGEWLSGMVATAGVRTEWQWQRRQQQAGSGAIAAAAGTSAVGQTIAKAHQLLHHCVDGRVPANELRRVHQLRRGVDLEQHRLRHAAVLCVQCTEVRTACA